MPEPLIDDDRDAIAQGDCVLLIIEDDPHFARILRDIARTRGFRCLVAGHGQTGLELVRRYQPHAITLDIGLPDVDGWRVLESLKNDPATRHIPLHIISVHEDAGRGQRHGAFAHLAKPVATDALEEALGKVRSFLDRKTRNLLVVEDDPVQLQSIVELVGNGDVQTTAVSSGRDGLAALQAQTFDCVVLDLGLPDIDGFQFLEEMKRAGLAHTPIIVYTARELPKEEESELRKVAQTIIVKDVRSPERLIDETALFLHRPTETLPEPQRQMLERLHQGDEILAGRSVLIVDDDIRNVFALTSVLERHGMHVETAENGSDALELLRQTTVDVVLMDIMMPEMDGYETMRAIRSQPGHRGLPIIALTAKAMKGDREKCIEAGASDYVAKPVDPDRLISLLRVWLYR
jgi:CheY-like chemotaxis protein